MKFLLRTTAAALALMIASPAAAAIVFDFNTNTLTVDANTALGSSVTISFDGHAPNNPSISGLTADLTLVFQGVVNNAYTFDYVLLNTSTAPIDAARVTAFGFTDVSQAVLFGVGGSSVTGGFTTVSSGNFPGGSDLDFCAKNGQNNNCAGSQGGPDVGASVNGDLTIGFSSAFDQIIFSGLAIRWQGIDSVALGLNDGSAIGSPTPPPPGVPEPATWAMMLMGFGAIGYTLRRRRRTVLAQVA